MTTDKFTLLLALSKAEREAAAVHMSRPMITLTATVEAIITAADLETDQRDQLMAIRAGYVGRPEGPQ